VLQEVAAQPVHEAPLGLEAAVNLYPTLAAQALINFSAPLCPQLGHSTSGSLPKTNFSNSPPQA
jgi:hypothetical protein